MKTSKVLQEARQLLLDQGWIKRISQNEAGAHCSLGALNKIDGGLCDSAYDAREAMREIIGVNDGHFISIAKWNDAETTDLAEVLKVFDAATSLAMSEEALDD